jgi:hypothetical protein
MTVMTRSDYEKQARERKAYQKFLEQRSREDCEQRISKLKAQVKEVQEEKKQAKTKYLVEEESYENWVRKARGEALRRGMIFVENDDSKEVQ